MDFTNTKLANFIEDKRRLPRPSRKKPYVRNEGRHKHGERRKVSATWFKKLGWKDNFQVYDSEIDGWLPEKKFDKNKKVEQDPRELMSYAQRRKIRMGENTEITEDARVDRMLGSHNFKISKFTDKDLEKFDSRSKYKTEEEWRTAAKQRVMQAHRARMSPVRYTRRVEDFGPLSASDALLILQEKKTYYSRCKCRGKCDCEAKMKAKREAKKNQIKESALVLYGKYYNTNITEPTIAEQFKKRIDYCIANERDFDFLQSNIYVELFESLINERQQDYDAFISDVEPQEDDLYKEAFTDEHVNNIVDEMFASETIDNLMDKRAEEEIAYINDNYKQKLKMMGLL